MIFEGFTADLHIHTLLSPCAELEMIPSLIVEASVKAGLDIIAITDHNSCENAESVIQASAESSLKVFPGIEAQSIEGVHLLCIFDKVEQAMQLQNKIYEALPKISGGQEQFRQQIVVDKNDEFIRFCEEHISLPSLLEISKIYELTVEFGGFVIPSHIDKSGTGLFGVLGILPGFPIFDAVEISVNKTRKQMIDKHPELVNLAIIQNSDSHWLSTIGSNKTKFHIARRSIEEIKMACTGENGRWIEYA